MARAQKLKVFRTPIGFHDAYVAAVSQKAALEAWGADTNLFAAGTAERVEDAKLIAEPLASPGKVIRRLRGSLDEHLAALPKDIAPAPRSAGRKATPSQARTPTIARGTAERRRRSRPRPDRTALETAEAALASYEETYATAKGEIARRQAELDRERDRLTEQQEKESKKLKERADRARARYDENMRRWRAE